MMPVEGSAAGGPVMFVPPSSPGHQIEPVIPSGLSFCIGGLNIPPSL